MPSSVARVNRLFSVFREGHRVERLLRAALLHAGRSHRHAGDGDAGDRRLLAEHALDVF